MKIYFILYFMKKNFFQANCYFCKLLLSWTVNQIFCLMFVFRYLNSWSIHWCNMGSLMWCHTCCLVFNILLLYFIRYNILVC